MGKQAKANKREKVIGHLRETVPDSIAKVEEKTMEKNSKPASIKCGLENSKIGLPVSSIRV